MTGLTIKDATGRVVVDMTMDLAQSMGSVDTGGANGSLALGAPPAGKTLFYIVVPLVDTQLEKGKLPGVTITGANMTWEYSFNTLNWGFFAAPSRIYYGYY
ncbi:hypothetical protein HX890_12085 [Pseudomonas gingeri]|uniref:hypothetical protein n=1 Tax=Pseudomonas gingeri TaxID=117681 RepID=UPI0015A0B32E|nr:hypothetical protein [Pseudomonas gingeri]NWD74843.1 hypothetical protein [Pseudomonas gingeri]